MPLAPMCACDFDHMTLTLVSHLFYYLFSFERTMGCMLTTQFTWYYYYKYERFFQVLRKIKRNAVVQPILFFDLFCCWCFDVSALLTSFINFFLSYHPWCPRCAEGTSDSHRDWNAFTHHIDGIISKEKVNNELNMVIDTQMCSWRDLRPMQFNKWANR